MSDEPSETAFSYTHGKDTIELYNTPYCAIDLDLADELASSQELETIVSRARPVKNRIVLAEESGLDRETRDVLDREGALMPVLSYDDGSLVVVIPEARIVPDSPDLSVEAITAQLEEVGLVVAEDRGRRLTAVPASKRAGDLLTGISELSATDGPQISAYPRMLRIVRRPNADGSLE